MMQYMKRNLTLVALAALFLVGCESRQTAWQKTQANAQNPEFVCEVRGQKLYRIEIENPNAHNHWIYFFDSNPVVTINHDVQIGNLTVNEVEVIIGGKHYIAVEKE